MDNRHQYMRAEKSYMFHRDKAETKNNDMHINRMYSYYNKSEV